MFILVFLATILTLVIIHELGHFFAAKKFGIKVLEFGFGLPPRIFGKKIGETIWSINWLPFGGFVRLLGEDEVDKEILDDKRSFAHQAVGKRIAVVIAGVFMNLILAWVLLYAVLIAQNFKIIYPSVDPIVTVEKVESGYPAYGSGINSGDKILKIDGKEVTKPDDIISEIKAKKTGEEVSLLVSGIDGSNIRSINIVPKEINPGEKRIGVVFSPIPYKQYNTPVEKIFSGITYSYDATKLTFVGLGKIFVDLGNRDFAKASQSVAGPVGLATITRDIVNVGREAALFYLWFVSMMSLTLAIFNVLPIPALDGGRLFFLLWEAATGKKPNPALERWVHTVGMVCLLSLIALITYSDIRKLL